MDCIIQKVTLENYKSIDKVTIQPDSNLSVFIGKNGTGKTVLMSALMILKNLLYEDDVYREKESEKKVEWSKIKVEFRVNNIVIRYYAEFSKEEGAYSERYITKTAYWNVLAYKSGRHRIKVPISFVPDLLGLYGNRSRSEHGLFSRSLFMHRYNLFRETNLGILRKFSNELDAVINYVEKMKYYSATHFSKPQKCPPQINLEDGEMVNRRKNEYSQFIYDLYKAKKEKPCMYRVFEDVVCDERLELVDQIQLVEQKLPSYDIQVRSGGKVIKQKTTATIIIPLFKKDQFTLSPAHLSEGTYKTIALLFYIFNSSDSALIIEEPEVCVHHALLENIVDIIKTYGDDRQTFVTTHSEALLDCVDSSNIFVTKWNHGTEVVKLKKFLGSKGLASLREYLSFTGNLGEYIRHKGI